HDQDAIALITLTWSLAKANLPAQVIEHIKICLKESGLPRIATRNIPEGTGYQLEIDGKVYNFPSFEWAPPEGYFSQDYVVYVYILCRS
ncbi:hypothetical protein L208DRAFT_1339092, partial [Tricholoma matsutake]